MNVLILGVGNAQVDAIRYCRERGHRVHGLSYLREGRGLAWLDAFDVIDITDSVAVCRYARDHAIAAGRYVRSRARHRAGPRTAGVVARLHAARGVQGPEEAAR